jgi:hypothetical protein
MTTVPNQQNNDPATSSKPEPSANQILSELAKSRETIQRLSETVQEQQRALVRLTTNGQAAPSTTDPKPKMPAKFENPAQFFDYVSQVVADQVNGIVENRMDSMLSQLTPLLREATKDAPVWGKTEMARKIADENPGISMELALELAETRMTKAKAQADAEKAEADKLATQERANQASVGARETSSGTFAPKPKGSRDIMEKLWAELDMDSKLQEHNAEADVWGAPDVQGVKILTPIPKDTGPR